MYKGPGMESSRCMDSTWVYNDAPKRQPDPRLKYSTLPGRDYETYRRALDMARRSADERGIYGTVPGRFVDRQHMRDLSPYRQLPTSRLPQGSILQDSTNWTSSLLPGARGPKMVRSDQKHASKSDYEGIREKAGKYTEEQGKKRCKLLKEELAEMMDFYHPGKQRGKEKDMEYDSVYGRLEADYKWEQKKRMTKHLYNDWEPLVHPPKALQDKLMPQTPIIPSKSLQHSTATKKLTDKNEIAPVQEKKKWWFKNHQSKPKMTDMVATDGIQEGSNKIYMEQSSIARYRAHKPQGAKENEPQQRKRRVPPPYIPPPSYNSYHHTVPFKREKQMNSGSSEQKTLGEILSMNNREKLNQNDDDFAKYSLQYMKNSKSTMASVKEDIKWADKMHRNDSQTYESIIKDKRCVSPYSTLERLRSQWQRNQSYPEINEYLEHIYETVEGGGSPLIPNTSGVLRSAPVPSASRFQAGEITYGMFSGPQQRDPTTQYTLSKTGQKGLQGINKITTISKRSQNVTNGGQQQVPHFDIQRPPISSHGVKLPYELGFSYTSGKIQKTNKKNGTLYAKSEDTDNEGQSTDCRRPLRVVSNKKTKTWDNSVSLSSNGVYGGYSHTLPYKRDAHYNRKTAVHEAVVPVHSNTQKIATHNITFPKWREPGKVSTLPGRINDHSRKKQKYGLRQSNKYNIPDLSNIALQKNQSSITTSEKMQPTSCKENNGLFVIDATCVVVRSEYIFPPRMEQVKMLPDQKTFQDPAKTDVLSEQQCSLDKEGKRKTSINSYELQSPLPKYSSEKNNSITQQYDLLSNESLSPNMKERAMRILGLSIIDLDLLNEAKEQHKVKESGFGTINCAQKQTEQENEAKLQKGDSIEHKRWNVDGNICKKSSSKVNENGPGISSMPEEVCTKEMYQSPSDIISFEEKHNRNSKENMSSIQEISHEESGYKSCSINKQILESIPNNNIPVVKIKDGSYPLPTDHTVSNMDADICLTKENVENSDFVIDPQHTMNQQLPQNQKDMHADTSEKNQENNNVSDKPAADQLIETRGECAEVDEECINKANAKPTIINIYKDNSERGLQINRKSIEVKQHSMQLSDIVKPDLSHLAQITESSAPTDTLASPRPPVKSYARRQNFFAKDLREAVSRIRRHTAPDSDTDEDLERPMSESGSLEDGSHETEEPVTSCSSDTSDSDVTVICCEDEREDEMSKFQCTVSPQEVARGQKNENTIANISGNEGFPLEPTKPNEITEQSKNNLILDSQMQKGSFDLSSCIEEILEDLSRTEEEFFPSSSEASSIS